MSDLQIGDLAPDFTLPRDGGANVTLSALRGAPVIVYFYPRDDTAGCTKQALGFTEAQADFAARGAHILGISKDSVAKHEKFRDKHGLGIALLSDENSRTCEAYGVWVEKSMYGRKFMGIERATFLIDTEGRLARIWRKVRVPGHVEAVLAALDGSD